MRKANELAYKKIIKCSDNSVQSKSLCYSGYMTINNGVATRDLPTHGWKNINGAGARRRWLVGSEVFLAARRSAPVCAVNYISHFTPNLATLTKTVLFPTRGRRKTDAAVLLVRATRRSVLVKWSFERYKSSAGLLLPVESEWVSVEPTLLLQNWVVTGKRKMTPGWACCHSCGRCIILCDVTKC